jgi:hypothetical protein
VPLRALLFKAVSSGWIAISPAYSNLHCLCRRTLFIWLVLRLSPFLYCADCWMLRPAQYSHDLPHYLAIDHVWRSIFDPGPKLPWVIMEFNHLMMKGWALMRRWPAAARPKADDSVHCCVVWCLLSCATAPKSWLNADAWAKNWYVRSSADAAQ